MELTPDQEAAAFVKEIIREHYQRIASKGGTASAKTRTKEQYSLMGKAGMKSRWANHKKKGAA